MGFLPIGADILPPSDDRIFKRLLTEDNMKPALIHLLSALLERKIVDVTLYPNEPPKDNENEKAERLDINGKVDDGSRINIEMIASRMIEDIGGRHQNAIGKSVFYLADLHSSQPAKGQKRYDRLSKTYQITFCTYTLLPDCEDYVNTFALRHDATGKLLTDAMHIIFVELSKLEEIAQKPVEDMTDLEKWSIFLQYAPDPERREVVNKVIDSEEVLQMAGEALMSISRDEAEQARIRSRRKYEMDMASNWATARDNGIFIGRREEKIEIARNALQNKMPPDLVAQITGLTLEEVERL